jgi:hypothetical protein
MAEDITHNLRQYLLAKHLEVFVPKSPATEGRLRLWLNHLMLKPALPMPQGSELRAELFKKIDPSVAEKLDGKHFWENIIYGYSIYETDGHFLTFTRRIKGYFTEQTLIMKFILTNYLSTNAEQLIKVETCEKSLRHAILPAWDVKPQKFSKQGDYTDLACTILHYNDIADYIVSEISENVLDHEQEVWAHGWNSILDRRTKRSEPNEAANQNEINDSRQIPIVLSQEEKSVRFEGYSDRVICVIDYSNKAKSLEI